MMQKIQYDKYGGPGLMRLDEVDPPMPGKGRVLVLPAAGALLSIPPFRRVAVRRLASVTVKAAPRPRPHSRGHAVMGTGMTSTPDGYGTVTPWVISPDTAVTSLDDAMRGSGP
jgi:hypothetical protein